MTNFGMQHDVRHAVANQSTAPSLDFGRDFGKAFQDLRMAHHAVHGHDGLDLFFVTSSANHGYRGPHGVVTPGARHLSEAYARALRPAGFRTLNWFKMTEPLPDASFDGVHYPAWTYAQLVRLLLHHLCSPIAVSDGRSKA